VAEFASRRTAAARSRRRFQALSFARQLAPAILGLCVTFVASADCGEASEAAHAVRAVAEGIILADNDRDVARVLAFYADDAIWLPPNESLVKDRAVIQQRYESLFQDSDPDIEGRIDEICVDGAIAFVRGHNGGWLVSRVGGRSRALDDVYLMVLRRESGGDWKISRLMWHPASAVAR
jgi:ketosteroid isomerase-like protein